MRKSASIHFRGARCVVLALAAALACAPALAAKAAGVDLKRLEIISFKSNSQSMAALLGGHIDLVASSLTPAIGHYTQGKTRIVAISALREFLESEDTEMKAILAELGLAK